MGTPSQRNRIFEPGRYYAAPVSVRSFNEELRRIGGLNPLGGPNLVCVWGMDKFWQRRGMLVPQYTGSIIEKRRVIEPKAPYFLPRVEITIERYGTPLWAVERWYPADVIHPQGRDHWNNECRFQWDEDEGKLIDMMGPYPEHGQYRCWMWVTDGDGGYAHPSDAVLEEIRAAWWHQQHDTTPLDQIIRDDFYRAKKRQERTFGELGERITDALKSCAHWIADPARKRKGGSGTRMIILPEGSGFGKKENYASSNGDSKSVS